MELVSLNKLEAVADFLADDEVFGIAPCSHFNNSLKRDRVDVSCDIGDCDGDCPFYSKENFLKWIKESDGYTASDLEKLEGLEDKLKEVDYELKCSDSENKMLRLRLKRIGEIANEESKMRDIQRQHAEL